MSYYQTLGLVREPFSNSPDPDLLYRSKNHLECLQHMEIAVRLRRGLNVVLGEVGTGKTTLARELMRVLGHDPDMEVYVLDDPYFPGIEEFLVALAGLFGLSVTGMEQDQGQLKDAIKAALLRKGGDGRRIVTLIVDEGQKITGECLELLRELLNFETNTHKLLQIVMFAQQEFDEVLTARPNLDDRVNFRYELRPLNRHQTRRMIQARLNLCSPDGQAPVLFTSLAFRRIYRLTGGYPRKIVRLCHMSMLLAVGMGRRRVDWGLAGRASREVRGLAGGAWRRRLALAGALGGLAATLALTGLGIETMVRQHEASPTMVRSAHGPATPPALADTAPVQPAPSVSKAPVMAPAPVVPPERLVAAAVPAVPAPSQPQPAPVVAAAVSLPLDAPASPRTTSLPAPQVTDEQPVVVLSPELAPQAVAAMPVPPAAPAWRLPAAMRSAHDLPVLPEARPAPAVQASTPAPAIPAGTPDRASDPVPATSGALAQAALATPLLDVSVPVPATPTPAVTLAAASSTPVAHGPASMETAAPSLLGESVTRLGWTVSRQAVWVYGNAARSVLAKMAKANPGLDFDRIRAGESLTFPAIETTPPPAGSLVLSFGQVGSLDKGLAKVAETDSPLPMILFVTHQPGKGLCIELVAYALYPDAETAKAALTTLPPGLAAKARLVEHYPEGTVFFTDLTSSAGKRYHPRATPAPLRRQVAESEVR